MTTPKPGYKKTDIGVIPADWEVKTLGEIADITMGQSPSSSFYNKEGIGLPLVQGNADIKDRQTIIRNYTSQITKRCSEGDIILSVRAPVGEVAKAVFDACLGRGVCAISYENEFLYHYLIFLEPQWGKWSKGSTFDSVNSTEVKAVEIPLPPLREQRAIANALGDVDALIAALDALIAKKRAIKTAAMQELLTGRTRLPRRDAQGQPLRDEAGRVVRFGGGAGYKKTEVGEIPEDWEVISFDDAFIFLATANNSRKDLSFSDEIFYIHYGDIHTKWEHRLDFSKASVPTIARSKFKNASFLKNGDIVMADASEDYSGIGKSVEITNLGNRTAIAGLHTFLLRDKGNNFVDGYRGYIQYNRAVKDSLDKLATGLKVFGISKTNLRTVLIPVPPLEEQRAIAEVLSDMDAEIAALEDRRAKTAVIKQGMMQELLTGRTRLGG